MLQLARRNEFMGGELIFLSYSRDDAVQALALETVLLGAGYEVIRDPLRIESDPFWRCSMVRLLDRCDAMVIVWSQHAARSPWVEHERRAFAGPWLFVLLDAVVVPGHPPRQCCVPSDVIRMLRRVAAPRNMRTEQVPPSTEQTVIARSRATRILAEESRLTAFVQHMDAPGRSKTSEIVGPHADSVVLADGSRLLALPATRSAADRSDGTFVSEVPVTNQQYRRFVERYRWPPPPTWTDAAFCKPDAPVVGVTWYEARAYAASVGADLPIERDWACAASASVSGAEFATLDGSLRHDVAFFGRYPGNDAPLPVAAYPPNPAGFYGMSGNTWDWCLGNQGPHRSIRGGSYQDNPEFCRIDARYRNSPIDRDCCVGFRLAVRAHPALRT
jgi:hypothetical protein